MPQVENISLENEERTIYHYYNAASEAIFKTVEIIKSERKILIYPYSVDKRTDIVTTRKLKVIEFVGWLNLNELPKDFQKIYGRTVSYGIYSSRLKRIFKFISYKFKDFDRLIITKESSTKFNKRSIVIKWSDLEKILNSLFKEVNSNNRNVKNLINNELARLTPKIEKNPRNLYYGDLERFMNKFDSFDKITDSDINSLSKLIELLPKNKISVTQNFIKTKEKINLAYFEDILSEFKKLDATPNDNEKKWQEFFEKNSWIFSHLFPFEVILRQREAYVGGKTFENKDGKVVDFLYQNGFKDNFALLEIKTHKKDLLKKTPYRGSDVFSMSDDLSGGINQCLDQKDVFLKDFGKAEKIIDPKCILVIGKRSDLTASQVKCFELIRGNQKNVDIVTFDELEKKIQGLLNVIAK